MDAGRGDSSVPLRDAARGLGDRHGPPGRVAHRREPFPGRRALLWRPRRDSGWSGPATEGPYELFIASSVLTDVTAHLAGDRREPRFGFLLGSLFRCPQTGIHYTVVDRNVRADEPFSEEAPNAYLLRAWADSQVEFRRHGGVLVGWYHSHYLLGLMLTEGDHDANDRYFSEPWQCCVVVVPDEERPLGGVFRPSVSDERARDEPTPFRELLSAEDLVEEDSPPTAVEWTNYIRAVEVQRETAVPDGAVSGFEGQPDTGGAESVIPVSTPPVDSAGGSAAEVRTEGEGRRWRRRWSVPVAVVLLGVVAGWLASGMLLEESAAPPPRAAEALVDRPAVAERALDERLAEFERALLGYVERARDFELGRIGCEHLARGHARVGEASLRVTETMAAAGEATAASRAAAYQALGAREDSVESHFAASGCPPR